MLKYNFHNIKKMNIFCGSICVSLLIHYINNEAVNTFKK